MAAPMANIYGVKESLPSAIPKVPNLQRKYPKSYKIKCQSKNIEEIHESRRTVLGIASIGILTQFGVNPSLAFNQDELWLTGPLPGLPPPQNKISNEETGTRSFLKKGIYMANIGTKGSALRLKKYAFDLLAMGDLISQDTLNYVRKYLRFKGTFMYYDFDKIISAASDTDKQPLTDLANRLFNNFEKLEDAAKVKDVSLTQSCYNDTAIILQDVMDRMA
ncbi:unnamed protein product [Amaranthus hypochondriacus]